MDRDQKAAVIEEVAGQIEESEAVFAVDYRGISVTQAAELRMRLTEADATFRVVKNTLTERAADRAGAEPLKALLQGPTAFTFVRGDAALAAKALTDLARSTGTLAFKGGVLGGEAVSAQQIGAIARLPSRAALYGQLVGVVASPISGLVRTLNALVGGLAVQLQAIADQGLVSGPAPPAPQAAPEPAAEAEAAPEPVEETTRMAEANTADAEADAADAAVEAAPDEAAPPPDQTD